MATYYVDDGGDNTTGADWATAYTSMAALDAARTISIGDVVYVGHDHVDAYGYSGSLTFTTQATWDYGTIRIISVTQGSDPPTYQKMTTGLAFDVAGGANRNLSFTGGLHAIGLRIKATGNIVFAAVNAAMQFEECEFLPGPGKIIYTNGENSSHFVFLRMQNCLIDCAADTAPAGTLFSPGTAQRGSFIAENLQFANLTYRTSRPFDSSNAHTVYQEYRGCDFSGFGTAGLGGFIAPGLLGALFVNCKFPAELAPLVNTLFLAPTDHPAILTGCGHSTSKVDWLSISGAGSMESRADVYRSGGAEVDGAPVSLRFINQLTTYGLSAPTPWIVGEVEAGSKTFTVHFVNDSALLTDAQLWLEVEFIKTSGEALGQLLSTRVIGAGIFGVTNHPADGGSAWNGSGPSFTYPQSVSVSGTVGEAGLYRARLRVRKVVSAAHNLYIDPKVIVT